MSDTSGMLRFLRQENARLTEENKRLAEQVNALREYILALDELEQATRGLSNERDLMSLLDKTLSYAIGVLNASDGSLMLIDEETAELVFVLAHGRARSQLPGYRIPSNEGIAGWVVHNKQGVIVNNARRDPRFSMRVDQAFNFETNSLVCAPLIARQRTLGVIEILNKTSGRDFTDTDLHLLSVLALVAALALDDIACQPEK